MGHADIDIEADAAPHASLIHTTLSAIEPGEGKVCKHSQPRAWHAPCTLCGHDLLKATLGGRDSLTLLQGALCTLPGKCL